jgi:hypothetical protein
MKFFNTAGPVDREIHYKIDPLTRWNMDEILTLIEQQKYFILHAPRQTGKTSCMLALRDYLNAEGRYLCVYANFEAAQTARNNVQTGMRSVLAELHSRTEMALGGVCPVALKDYTSKVEENALNLYLADLCGALDKSLILLIDEIDALVGDTLVSVLRQLRSGYDKRPAQFPQSVILCGVRDIKDYRIHRGDGEIITGGSCFNIKSESLTLGNFSEDEVRRLYGEHTRETGQLFDEGCFPLVMRYTAGQPWLVNALAYEVTFKMKENRDPSVTITAGMFEEARERLILSRATHLDQLADKLKEDRVRRVIEPMLIGATAETTEDDTQYCTDLGLIRKQESRFVISNDIYKEVIPRELTQMRQDRFGALFHPEWVNPDGALNSERLFTMFQAFWRENSEIWRQDIAGYVEAAPHLTFQAFLQRVANGNGYIGREYAYGTKRADLVLKWRWAGGEQRVVIELKLITERDSYAAVKAAALEQTAAYAALCDATEAHVVVFDRRGTVSWDERIFTDSGESGGVKIKIWAM